MEDGRVSVLIVGAGLAGLSTALTLALRGIPPLVVEKHASFSRHPRARGLNARSMELLRCAGLQDELCQGDAGTFGDFTIIHADSVFGAVRKTIVQRGAWEIGLSPARSSGMAQSRVEPILQRRAEELGATVHFSNELTELREEGTHVEALVRDRATGSSRRIRALYVVAADGHNSTVRSALGIGTQGAGLLCTHTAIVFTADRPLPGHAIYYLRQDDFVAAFIHMDDSGLSVLSVENSEPKYSARERTPSRCFEYVRRALGADDIRVEISDILPYDICSFAAESLSTRRVFLVGDAAHTMPPIGGLGGQAAIQDGFDIGWKLELVLRKIAGESLLTSYASERGPVGALTLEHQTDKYYQRMRPSQIGGPTNRDERAGIGIGYAYRYRSECISSETADDGRDFDDPIQLSGNPGTRAPYATFMKGCDVTSVLEHLGGDFIVVVGRDGHQWVRVADRLRCDAGLPVSRLHFSTDIVDPDGTWPARHGISDAGALLFRPDGFVAWRAYDSTPGESVLELALRRALCLSPVTNSSIIGTPALSNYRSMQVSTSRLQNS